MQKFSINFSARYLSPVLLKTTTNLPSSELFDEVNFNSLNLMHVCVLTALNASCMLVFAVFSIKIVDYGTCYKLMYNNIIYIVGQVSMHRICFGFINTFLPKCICSFAMALRRGRGLSLSVTMTLIFKK